MNLRKEFVEAECEWFRAACNFTQEEREIFDLRVKDKSRVQIAMELNMTVSTVDRRIKNIKRKISKVL